MTAPLRLAAASAVLVFAASPSNGAVAEASGLSCDDQAALDAAVALAEHDVVDARAAFRAAQRPLGRLVAAKRHEARLELAQSRAAVKDLRDELRSAATKEDARSAAQALREERRDISHARDLLDFKRVALAEIKADKVAARAAVSAARTQLAQVQAFRDACAAPEPPEAA